MNYLIGCGGVGSAIVPSLCLLKSPAEITLIDGDRIESKNLDRQLFDHRQIGMNKAEALAARYGCRSIAEWFARGRLRHHRNDWLICLVDNHRTRREALEVCDETGCQAISPRTKRIRRKPTAIDGCGKTPGAIRGFTIRKSITTRVAIHGPRPSAVPGRPRKTTASWFPPT
jgi:tRNA A37 threonylcarbamoyladenosine dehydratase